MGRLNVKAVLLILFAIQPGIAQEEEMITADAPLINTATNCILRYYYYPNLEAYFDTSKKLFYFKVQGEWQTAEEIPNGYRGYSTCNKYNIFITDYDDDHICQFIDKHKKKYPYITNEKLKKLIVRN